MLQCEVRHSSLMLVPVELFAGMAALSGVVVLRGGGTFARRAVAPLVVLIIAWSHSRLVASDILMSRHKPASGI